MRYAFSPSIIVFGPLNSNPNIIVASGWNRVGFTLSPLIAKELVNFIKHGRIEHINGWAPDRKPISFGSVSQCANFYASAKCANMIEHRLLTVDTLNYKNKFNELKMHSLTENNIITKKFKLAKGFGVHPDLYQLLNES